MRHLILVGLLAAIAAPTAVAAQSRDEVRDSQRDVRQEQREYQDARRYGDRNDIRHERRDVEKARQELREDRRDYRQARLRGDRDYRPSYVAPYRGWNYRPVAPGYQLRPAFFGPRYVINPVQYRLPPVRRDQQWVRYGDDLLLVNVRNGRVIQILRGRY